MKTKFEIFINEHISPDRTRSLKYKTELPLNDEIFMSAVENTTGTKILDDGLLLNVVRYQKPEQDGETSIRTGVFYLPIEDKNIKEYRGGKSGYGGTDKYEGEILLKNPLFIKGATGGKVPENAYDKINGKGSNKKLLNDIYEFILRKRNIQPENIGELLTKYNKKSDYSENCDLGYDMIINSKQSNLIRYAIQENIIANSVRDAGYDSVLGYSRRRNGDYYISEIFDVRELTYPSNEWEADIHSKFL